MSYAQYLKVSRLLHSFPFPISCHSYFPSSGRLGVRAEAMTSDPATRAQPESPSKTTSVRISNVHLVDIVTLFALGIFVGSGLCFARLATGYFSIATYLGLLSLFHAMEFLVTAAYQPSKVSFDCISI